MNSLIFIGDAQPMEDILKEVIKNMPIAGVLLAAGYMALKHIEKKDRDMQETQKIHRETFERLHAAYDEQQERSGIIIGENNKVLGRIDSTLQRIEQKVS